MKNKNGHNSAPWQATELRICMRGVLDEFQAWGTSPCLGKLQKPMCFLKVTAIKIETAISLLDGDR